MTGHDPGTEVLYPKGRRSVLEADAGPFAFSLYTVSLMVSVLSGLSRNLKKRALPEKSVQATVISIGNIEVGGTGKTPFSFFLIEELLRRGHKPAYVSRGYASTAEKLRAVTVVPPHDHGDFGAAPPLRWIARGSRRLYLDIGDEGALVSRRLPDVPLVFSRKKLSAVELADELFSPTHIILDDAFQSWSVPRDIDIVLLDATNPLADRRLIPYGRLREGAGALRRADVLCFVGHCEKPNSTKVEGELEPYINGKPRFTMSRRLGFYSSHGEDRLPERPCGSLSGIAKPGSFEDSLKSLGAKIRLSLRYPDHHRYEQGDVDFIARKMQEAGLDTLVTTEKDWVKIEDLDFRPLKVIVARLDLACVDGDPAALIEGIKRPRS